MFAQIMSPGHSGSGGLMGGSFLCEGLMVWHLLHDALVLSSSSLILGHQMQSCALSTLEVLG